MPAPHSEAAGRRILSPTWKKGSFANAQDDGLAQDDGSAQDDGPEVSSGNVIEKVVPSPTLLLAAIFPPIPVTSP